MKKITLPDMNWKVHPKIFVGNRERYSTATAVSFVDDNLILVASFLGKKIYLIDVNKNEIIDEVNTKYTPDLMDYKNGVILTSDYPYAQPHGYASLYNLIDNKIVYKKEIKLNRTKVHGGKIIDSKNVVVTSNSDDSRGCVFIDIETNQTVKHFNNFKFYPKDIFLTDDRILIVTSESLPNIGTEVVVKQSFLYLFDRKTFEKIDEMSFPGQTDSLTLIGQDGFINLQAEDSLVHFKLIDDKLSFIKLIGGFDFPHGVSSFNDNVAVTNYGDNSVRVFKLSELIY